MQVKSVMIPNLHPNTLDLVDLFEGPIFEGVDPAQFEFLPCERKRLSMAVPAGHPLAGKRILSMKELKGYSVVTFRPGLQKDTDLAAEFLRANDVMIHQVNYYDPAVMIQCAKEQELVLFVDSWLTVVPVFTIVPMEWDFTCRYGLFFKRSKNPVSDDFRDYVRRLI